MLEESETGAVGLDHAIAAGAVTPPSIGEELGLQFLRNLLDVRHAAGTQALRLRRDPVIEIVIGEIDDAAKAVAIFRQEPAVAETHGMPPRSDAA